jgi:phage terminase large subunit-like protein
LLLEPLLKLIHQHGLEDNPEAVIDLIGDDKAERIYDLYQQEQDQERYEKFKLLFPDLADCDLVNEEGYRFRQVGSFRFFAREYYQKHLEFFRAGAEFRARCLMAANRVGKTFSAGGFEMTCHLTGDYPEWWEGRKFRHPVRAWACGKTNETTRDIVQTTLLGDIEYRGSLKRVDGTGVIPRECIGMEQGQLTWKQGVQDLIDTVKIRHKQSGGWSKLGLKSYQQGRGSFEGTAQHVIWDDEEPPEDVYGEQIIRTTTTGGVMMLTFTPLEGMSEVVQRFLPNVGID